MSFNHLSGVSWFYFDIDLSLLLANCILQSESIRGFLVFFLLMICLPRPGFQYGCKCIALDGKLYMLGGGGLSVDAPTHDEKYLRASWTGPASREVFMLDVAGQKQWKKCASMQEPRHHFSTGVLNGKIYVFGGNLRYRYDPKLDVWYSIADMNRSRMGHQVVAVGGELFVYGGQGPNVRSFADLSQDLLAYDPVKNDWRQIVGANMGYQVVPFLPQGMFHVVDEDGIAKYAIEANSWQGLQSFLGLESATSGEFLSSILQGRCGGWYVLPLGDEILIVSHSSRGGWDDRLSLEESIRLVQTREFGLKNRTVTAEKMGNSRLSSDLRGRLGRHFEMCLIQL